MKEGRNLDGWRETTLRSLITIKHGFAFAGHFIHDRPHGHMLLTPGNFAVGGGFKGQKFKYYSGPVPHDFVFSERDLVVTMTDLSKASDTLGYLRDPLIFSYEQIEQNPPFHIRKVGKVRTLN